MVEPAKVNRLQKAMALDEGSGLELSWIVLQSREASLEMADQDIRAEFRNNQGLC